MEKYQRVVAAAFIRKEDQVLIAKRSTKCKVFPGMYELLGGKIEFGETPEHALEREIKEELGVSVKVMEPCHVFSYICHEGRAHYVEVVFMCELAESEDNIKMLDHDDIQWVTREELGKFEMSTEMRKAIEKGFDLRPAEATEPSHSEPARVQDTKPEQQPQPQPVNIPVQSSQAALQGAQETNEDKHSQETPKEQGGDPGDRGPIEIPAKFTTEKGAFVTS